MNILKYIDVFIYSCILNKNESWYPSLIDRQSCKTAKCLLLLHGETNLTLMRNEDIRKHLGTTAAENHLCALSSFSY